MHLSLLPPWGNGYDLSASFKKKKNPIPGPCLMRDTGSVPYLSFTFWHLNILKLGLRLCKLVLDYDKLVLILCIIKRISWD